MSYNIIKGIKIDQATGKVYVNAASNNVFPRTFYNEEAPYFNRILKEQGLAAVELSILKAYESGDFQPGVQNKYTRAFRVLIHMPEYAEFNWRNEPYKAIQEKRQTHAADFDALLVKALHTPEPSDRFVITKTDADGNKFFFNHRRNSSFGRWYPNLKKAKVYKYRADAEFGKRNFPGSQNWSIEQLGIINDN